MGPIGLWDDASRSVSWGRRSAAVLVAMLASACSGEVGDNPSAGGSGSQPGSGGSGVGGSASGAGGTAASGGVAAGAGAGVGGASAGGAGGSTGGTAGAGATAGSGAGPSACTPGAITPGRSPLRRLSAIEYDNTVFKLMGTETVYSSVFPADTLGAGFSTNSISLDVGIRQAEGYMTAAEEMAAAAITNLGAYAPACDPAAMGAATCADTFIKAFGKKAFRRPLDAEEVTRYTSIFTTGSTGATYNDGISLVIEAMLQSPHFLYRVEVGQPTADANVLQLGPYEMASRLSYFLWGAMPDDALFAAADAGGLMTPEALAAEVTRMMSDMRAHSMVARFHREWLQVPEVLGATPNLELFGGWTGDIAEDMFLETDTFLKEVFWNDGSLRTMFTAPYSYMNSRLAGFYGVQAPAGDAFVKVDLDPTQRAGFLTFGAFLAGHTNSNQYSPIFRGKFVREQILCEFVESPDPELAATIRPPEPTADTTTRQRFEAHRTDPICAGCHTAMDPIGYTFANYDPVGRWQTMDGPGPVDASGEIIDALRDPGLAGPIVGAIELAAKLAGSPQVADCMAEKWYQWGIGRPSEMLDACSIEKVQAQFRAANLDMRTIPASIVGTDAFRYRSGVTQ
jgi:hypothetical protein